MNDEITKYKYGWLLIDFVFFNFLVGFFLPFIYQNITILKRLQLWWYKIKKTKSKNKNQKSKSIKINVKLNNENDNVEQDKVIERNEEYKEMEYI